MQANDFDLTPFESDEAPSAEDLARAPRLNEWRAFTSAGEVHLSGRVVGHHRLPDGLVTTSAVQKIGKDRKWCRTRNTLYALADAVAKERLPDVLQMIDSGSWEAACRLLTNWTLPHASMLPPRAIDALGTILSREMSWPERRELVKMITHELARAGLSRCSDMWVVLRADPEVRLSCSRAANYVVAAFEEWSAYRGGADDDEEGRRIEQTVRGWQYLANVDRIIKGSADPDPIQFAAKLGQELVETPEVRAKEEGSAPVRSIFDGLRDGIEEEDTPRSKSKHTIIVLREIGGTSFTTTGKEAAQELRHLVRERVPLIETPDLVKAREALVAEFPHLATPIAIILSDLVGRKTVRIKPTLICGPVGSAKSTLCRKICIAIGIEMTRFDAASSSDSTFGGTPRRWNSGEPSVPLQAIRSSMTANPAVLIDEIDKSGGTGGHNGRLFDALLPFLEIETSSRYPDPYVQAQVDLSHISFLATANDELALPRSLRDRFRLIRIPLPTVEHIRVYARTIVSDLAIESGIGRELMPDLSEEDLYIASKLWGNSGSLRRLRAIVSRILAHRDAKAMRH